MSGTGTLERAAPAPESYRPAGVIERWWRPWLAVLLLARYDAGRHRARTMLAVLLVALPIAAMVGGTVLTQSTVPSRESALAGIPAGVQAVIVATTVKQPAPPFEQVPEGAGGSWLNDPAQRPATESELAAVLPEQNRLLQYWTSPQLLVTNALDLQPGQQEEAGSRALADVDAATISSGILQESDPQGLALLVPELAAGTLPSSPSEVVLTTALAQRLDIEVGGTVTLVAPPVNSSAMLGGRLGAVIEDSQRGYRVTGLVEGSEQQAWALSGWISAMVATSPGGIEGRWLSLGAEPVTWEQARQLNEMQAFAVSRHVLENYPDAGKLYPVPMNPVELLNRIISLAITGLVGALMVLFLVTPAFAVSTEQSRRTLGMAAATGATPKDLRRIVTAQGLVVGTAGGVVGGIVGFAGGLLMRQVQAQNAVAVHYPWWILPVGVGLAAALGVVATWLPARSAAHMQPVDAIKDKAGKAPQGSTSKRRLRLADAGGPLLLLAAIACGVLSLTLPLPKIMVTPQSMGGSGDSIELVALMFAGLVLFVLGLVACLRTLVGMGSRLAGLLPTLPRLALRDAHENKSRFLPAAAGILVAVLAASFMAVSTGSSTANFSAMTGEFIANGRLLVGAAVPVNQEFDRVVIEDAIENLATQVAVVGHEPVFGVPVAEPLRLGPIMPSNKSCPAGQGPDAASAMIPGSALECVELQFAHRPGPVAPWQSFSSAFIMEAAAVRSSGRDGAEAAAAVLESGGAVVNNAAMLSDTGTVRIGLGNNAMPDEQTSSQIVIVPGAFMPGFGAELAISAATAKRLGVGEPEFLGEIVELAPGMTPAQVEEAAGRVRAHTSLVAVGTPYQPYPWGRMGLLLPLGLLALVAMAAAAITILLARTQSLRDAATMHAVGATPRFLRRFTLVQAAVVLGSSVPLGALAGLGLGWYLMAWRRRTAIGLGDGPWLEIVPLWGVQGVLVLAVIFAGLLTAWIAGRPARSIMRRALD